MYAAALSHYRRAFGAEVPAAVWPAVDRRFDAAPAREDTFIQLQGEFASGLFLAFVGLAGVVAMALGLDLLGLLDATHAMSGPAFLHLAFPVTIALVVLGWLSTGPFARPRDRDLLDTYEAAWLMGGDGRMAAAALGLLIERGCAAVRTCDVGVGWRRRSVTQFVVTADAAARRATLHPVEVACLDSARDGLLTFERAHLAMRPWALQVRRRLRAAGLAADDRRIAPARAAMAGVTAAWLVVAIERILHAIGSPRPVGFLVMLTVADIVVFLALTLRLGRPNWRGKHLLEELRQELRLQRERGARRAGPAIEARLLPMTLALMGPAAVLAEPVFAGFDDALGPDGMRSAGLNVVGSSDGGGGDGGGCGGGGCGGGGCGG